MKKILLSLLTIFIIQGCSQNSESESSTSSFVEYVWHTAVPDFSSDNLAKLISDWNSIITSSGCDMDGANILTPLEASPDYDFIWVCSGLQKIQEMHVGQIGWQIMMLTGEKISLE